MKSILRPALRGLRPGLVGVLLSTTLASTRAQAPAPVYVFSHLAGSIGGPGSTDGIGPAARFNSPASAAVDGAGNVYVADTKNHTIRRITAGGVVTTMAGTAGIAGSADGIGSAARFKIPHGVAVDSTGTVYVTDTGNFTVRKITPGGVVTTLAGTAGHRGLIDGTGSAAEFDDAQGIAVDNAGNVYVAEVAYNTIRRITPGGVVTTLAAGAGFGSGSEDGTGPAAQFDHPIGLAVDGAGTVYVADSWNQTIRKISAGGVVTTLAGLAIPQPDIEPGLGSAGLGGSADGTGPAARFNGPTGMAADNAGNVYVTDLWNNTIRKITPGGAVTTLGGTADFPPGSADGTGPAARFSHPNGIAVDATGSVYVADTDNHTIRKITPDGVVSTLAGMANLSGRADGIGQAARFNAPRSVAVDSAGNVYVADTINCAIRKITPAGVATTLAGAADGSADGTGLAAQFFFPQGAAVDSTGTVYVADTGNNTIRKITPGGVVTTLAGTPGVGTYPVDGTGPAARFDQPFALAVDGAGTVYVADTRNNMIRKITPAGVVTTLAGTAANSTYGGSADGTGPAAQFEAPCGIAVDSAGMVYVADALNSTIRKITPEGVVTTLAGTAGARGSADGTGAAARFNTPRGVAVDGTGNVYVSDQGDFYDASQTIRKITPEGVVTTLGGIAGVAGSEDGIGPAARFNSPDGVAVDGAGTLYVADSDNNAVRKGVLAVAPVITTQPQSQTVAAGASVQFSVVAGGVPAPTFQWYFNGGAFDGANTATLSFTGIRSTDAGNYTVVVTNSLGSVSSTQATLTIAAAPVTPPAASASGGGGLIDAWFVLAMLAAGVSRWQSGWNRGTGPHTVH